MAAAGKPVRAPRKKINPLHAKRITEEFEAIEPGAAPAEEEEDTLEHALTARLPATTEAPDPEAPPDRASDGHQAPRRPSSRD